MQQNASFELRAESDADQRDLDDTAGRCAETIPSRRRDHHWHFLRQWVRHPLRTASMLPSSRALARLMVSEIGPHTGRVLELGGGTGAVTEEILRTGVARGNLTVIELNARFAALLRREYPGIRVVRAKAQHLPSYLHGDSLGAVISSLPMLSMSPREQRRVLAQAFGALHADGHFYQYTYGHRCPVSRQVLDSLDIGVCCIGGTLRNWPPARVFRMTRGRDAVIAPPRSR